MSNTSRARTLAVSVLTLAVAAATLAGCAGSGDDDAPASGETITVDGVEFPAPEKTTIKLGIPGITTGGLAEYYAIGAGIYEEFGLDVEMVSFQSGAQTTQALLANQIDVADADISILSALVRPDPPAYTVVINDHMTDGLVVRGDIETAEDLKGESIAISQFGSQSYAGALLALKEIGLDESDVTLTQVGSGSDRLAALLAGSVGGSINDPYERQTATEQGFHTLVDIADIDSAGIVRTSLAFNRSFIQENPNTVLAMTAAILKARHDMYDDPEGAASYFAPAAGLTEEEALEGVNIELSTLLAPPGGECRSETVTFMKEVLLSVDDSLSSINPEDACDNSFIDTLDDLGWIDTYSL